MADTAHLSIRRGYCGGFDMLERSGGALRLAALLCVLGPAAPVAAPAADSLRATAWDKLEPVCDKCHNSTDWAGSIAFDTLSPDDIGAEAEIWEKTVRK